MSPGLAANSGGVTARIAAHLACADALRREYRVLLGHTRSLDKFIDTSRIGTDALFERCTHFSPLDGPAANTGKVVKP